MNFNVVAKQRFNADYVLLYALW